MMECNTIIEPTGIMLGQYKRVLGKVVPTTGGAHDRHKSYDRLVIVYDQDTLVAYISKQDVPEGVEITNRDYWQPMNVSGYHDDNVIIITDRNESGQLIPYTLETVLPTIHQVARKPGALLSFFSLEGGGHWELWQYCNDTVVDWENEIHWKAVYNTYNKFAGWYNTLEDLLKVYVGAYDGRYAIIGETFRDAKLYEGRADGWYDTGSIFDKFMDDLIYNIQTESVTLTPEQKGIFKSFMCGTDYDGCDCGSSSFTGVINGAEYKNGICIGPASSD